MGTIVVASDIGGVRESLPPRCTSLSLSTRLRRDARDTLAAHHLMRCASAAHARRGPTAIHAGPFGHHAGEHRLSGETGAVQ